MKLVHLVSLSAAFLVATNAMFADVNTVEEQVAAIREVTKIYANVGGTGKFPADLEMQLFSSPLSAFMRCVGSEAKLAQTELDLPVFMHDIDASAVKKIVAQSFIFPLFFRALLTNIDGTYSKVMSQFKIDGQEEYHQKKVTSMKDDLTGSDYAKWISCLKLQYPKVNNPDSKMLAGNWVGVAIDTKHVDLLATMMSDKETIKYVIEFMSDSIPVKFQLYFRFVSLFGQRVLKPSNFEKTDHKDGPGYVEIIREVGEDIEKISFSTVLRSLYPFAIDNIYTHIASLTAEHPDIYSGDEVKQLLADQRLKNPRLAMTD
ncbi:hypothetical protein IWQ60_010229 [Tieghemiomyces parasiticus]|uniref:Uncharacterized protein n=1 Tax=Tieghemiomyces parasiticus TaxID=78921 RepID=A0A9W7ZLQ5_9FUNG|nr:hypothetical protein IWQ60_010229 [Tieghemiomyces parasiticus]